MVIWGQTLFNSCGNESDQSEDMKPDEIFSFSLFAGAETCRRYTQTTEEELVASRRCAVTQQRRRFSYLLPLGFSASP